MRTSFVMVLSTILAAALLFQPARADEQGRKKKQFNAQAAGQTQFAGQMQASGPGMLTRSSTTQVAQRMIAMFDQDGDAALNLIELQAGLTGLFEWMSQKSQQAGLAAANQATDTQTTETQNQLRNNALRAPKGPGFRSGPRGH